VAATLFALGAATALRVADEGSGFEVSTTSATDAMRGRGLFFVKTLAQSLVVETGASVVEAVLPVRLRGGMESPRA
jgi:anti-sigma regulatory factor (Ser/Thr protein kinase)